MADTWSKRDIMGLYMALKQGIGWERELLQEHSETIINLVYKIGTPRREPQPVDWEEVGALMEKISLAAHDHYFTPGRTKEYIIKEFSGDIAKKIDGDQVLNDMLKKPPKPIFNEAEKALFDFPYPWIAGKAEAAGVDAELLQYAFNICDDTSIYYLQELAQAAHNSLTGTSKSRLECLGEYAEALINALIKKLKSRQKHTSKNRSDVAAVPSIDVFKNSLFDINHDPGKAYIDALGVKANQLAENAIQQLAASIKEGNIVFKTREQILENGKTEANYTIIKQLEDGTKQEEIVTVEGAKGRNVSLSDYNMTLVKKIYCLIVENYLKCKSDQELYRKIKSNFEIPIIDLLSNDPAGKKKRGTIRNVVVEGKGKEKTTRKVNEGEESTQEATLLKDIAKLDELYGFTPSNKPGYEGTLNIYKLISFISKEEGILTLNAPHLQMMCAACFGDFARLLTAEEKNRPGLGHCMLLKKSFFTCKDKVAAEILHLLCLQIVEAGSEVNKKQPYKPLYRNLSSLHDNDSPELFKLEKYGKAVTFRMFLQRFDSTLKEYFKNHTTVYETYVDFSVKIIIDGEEVGKERQNGRILHLNPGNWERATIEMIHYGTIAAKEKRDELKQKEAAERAEKKRLERAAAAELDRKAVEEIRAELERKRAENSKNS